MGHSVTSFIRQHKQPYGGYLPKKLFAEVAYGTDNELYPLVEESVHPTLMGLAVDYVSRMLMGLTVHEAFDISFLGASVVSDTATAKHYAKVISGMDLTAISMHETEAIFKLVRYDSAFRAGWLAYHNALANDIIVSQKDVHNLQEMVNRTRRFLTAVGPVVDTGSRFEGAYTPVVSSGDMDFITEGILWDMKVSKNPPDKNATMQLLCYTIMGRRSIHAVFRDVHSIGVFNPRLNTTYTMALAAIDPFVISEVEHAMGY